MQAHNDSSNKSRSAHFRRRRLTFILSGFVIVPAAGQVLLGADPAIVVLASTACLVGLLAFRILGLYNTAGWLALVFVFGNALLALNAKTWYGQALQSNLDSPLESFAILWVGCLGLFLAATIARSVPVGRPLFFPTSNLRTLLVLSNGCLVLGAPLWILNWWFQSPDGSGFGGIAVFWNLFLMAVIARTAFVFYRSGGRRTVDFTLILILVCTSWMGFINNSKTEVALPVVAFFATCFFFGQRISGRLGALCMIGLIVFAGFLAPSIHVFRTLGVKELSFQERTSLFTDELGELLTAKDFRRYTDLARVQFQGGYYDYFGNDQGQMLLGRFASIQQIDPVVARIGQQGTLGGSVVWQSFPQQLPRVIHPGKPKYIPAYYILTELGLIDPNGGKFPTTPMLAQAYAGYGLPGVVLIPFLTFLAMILSMKKLGWNLHRNVYAIFFLTAFIIVYASQGSLDQYVGALLRSFPLLAMVIMSLNWMARRSSVSSLQTCLEPR